MTTPEGKVKEWLAYRMEKRFGHLATWEYSPPGGPFGQSGTADRLYLIESGCDEVKHLYEKYGRPSGVLVLIEAKAVYANGVANQPTALQLKRLRDIDRCGGVAATMIGKDQEKLDRIYLEIDRRREINRFGWLRWIEEQEMSCQPSEEMIRAMMETNEIYGDLPFQPHTGPIVYKKD